MEINIKNAFKVAVKSSCGLCYDKYNILTEKIKNICLKLADYFLKTPLLTTFLFSVFMIVCVIIFSTAFIILIGVLIFIVVILLVEGFIFFVLVTVISMIIATVVIIIMILGGINYNASIIDNED